MLKKALFVILALIMPALGAVSGPDHGLQYQSAFMRVDLAAHQPAFVALVVDSLGKKNLSANPLRPPVATGTKYHVTQVGPKFEYRRADAPASAPPAWTFGFSTRYIYLQSDYSPQDPPSSLVLNFNTNIDAATLLGLMNDDGTVRLPALLHMPDHGTLRITSGEAGGLALGYDALRYRDPADNYVKVTFPAASSAIPRVSYTLEVVDIYPDVPGIAGDPRFDGFRRNWLNIFQLSPRYGALANNAASDVCAFTVYEYAEVALHTPPLAKGLTALDLIRQTLDRYLGGMKGYGIRGYSSNDWTTPYDYVDTYPSLLIAAWDYVRGSKDEAWLERNYKGVRAWATRMLAMDRDGKGLLEYPASGDSSSWIKDNRVLLRPANWWDTIGFGHLDAYSNALAYHALLGMAELAQQAKRPEDAQFYVSQAEKLRSVYFDTFYDPMTGVLAGWKSTDGKLHDYYFTFVNAVAITYGLVPHNKANEIMDQLLAKMKQVGYTCFEYGLPGNLISVRRADYVAVEKSSGAPKKEDGSDGFQIYENGGATADFAFFTLHALYQLGRCQEADAMLFPMLRAFEAGGFQGRGANGKTYDWKAWDGTPHGYEGFLVDNYMTLLAVLARNRFCSPPLGPPRNEQLR